MCNHAHHGHSLSSALPGSCQRLVRWLSFCCTYIFSVTIPSLECVQFLYSFQVPNFGWRWSSGEGFLLCLEHCNDLHHWFLCKWFVVFYFSVFPSPQLLLLNKRYVSGPYCLITTAVSAELGQHPSLQVWIFLKLIANTYVAATIVQSLISAISKVLYNKTIKDGDIAPWTIWKDLNNKK